MKIKKNDQVLITTGKDRGRRGKVLQVFPRENRILIEGVNLRKRHLKPKKSGEKGEIVQRALPLNASNVKLVCARCGQPTRVGYKIVGEKKFRMCKKCGQELGS